MNTLLVVFLILIILSIFYLYYRNQQYRNILESFDNNTQNSLSTYFQNTVDYDTYGTNKMAYNNNVPVASSIQNWNGIWQNKDLNIYAQFIQNNDQLIISLSNSSSIQTGSTAATDSTTATVCSSNLFIGIGQLNINRNIFNLVSVSCPNYTNVKLNLVPNTANALSGYINGKTIILNCAYGITPTTITLTNTKFFTATNPYITSVSPYTSQYNILPASEMTYNANSCTTGSLCINKSLGLDTSNFNACGTPNSGTDSTCTTVNTNCIFNSIAINGVSTCSNTPTYDFMNFINYEAPGLNSQYNGSSLQICDYLTYFKSSACNSCIICYVTNLGNVQTLNYQFFGSSQDESALTTQADIMNQILNKIITPTPSTCTSVSGLLPFYRTAITGSNQQNINKAISFTNCIETNSSTSNSSTMQTTCKNTVNTYISNYTNNPTISNNNLSPAVWQINLDTSKNVLNSCPFTLSTSSNYNTPVKYVELNSDGSTSLSLFKDGTKQQLMLENINIIKPYTSINSGSTNSVAITANIKTNNKLYLVPSTDNSGFSNNSNLVRQVATPDSNGKWLIIGFTSNNLNSLIDDINKITFSA